MAIFAFVGDRRSRFRWGLRLSVLLLHLIFVGVLFLFDGFLIKKLKDNSWCTAIYLILFAATLVQYLFTSCSSPGYVVDAIKAQNGVHATFTSKQAFSGNRSLSSTKNHSSLGRQHCQMKSSPWFKIVMELYPPGESTRNWTCLYCNILQPPRTKHCNECHKCVLQFDHHCAWLGTCIGRGNHCRFWWKDLLVIVLLAILIFCLIFLLLLLLFHSYLLLTNQTTYEIIRRRRITYLSEIPFSVHLFSKGVCKNLSTVCCFGESKYTMEAVPLLEDIESRARLYTCYDTITCRCC